MNKSFINKTLLCLVAMTMACMPEVKAQCVNSGFGVGLMLGTQRNKVKFNADKLKKLATDARANLIKQLTDALKETSKKFDKPNTKDTEMVDSGEEYTVTTYKDDGSGQDSIEGATQNKLGKAEVIKLKTKKFKSDNPTKYRIANSDKEAHGKYDDNGMCDNNKGILVNKAIPVNPQLLANNGGYVLNALADNVGNDDYSNAGNYRLLTKDGTRFFLTPRDGFILSEMDKALADDGSTNPTHVKLDDLSGDKITYAFLTSLLNNSDTLKEYQNILSGDDLFIDKEGNTNKYYINTVKHKDLGLSDTFVNNAVTKLSPDTAGSQTFKDASKWSFDIGLNLFYQYRIYDWFIRGGVFGNFPVANKTVSIMESKTENENKSNDDSKKKSSDNDFSISRQAEAGIQLLGGYNITQNFAIVGGVELGLSWWKVNNLDKLSSVYQLANSQLAKWVMAGNADALKGYDESLKNMGLSDKEKKITKFFWRAVIGLEYNFNNFIIGLQGLFGPDTKIMKESNNSDLGDLKVSNIGARLIVAYKF